MKVFVAVYRRDDKDKNNILTFTADRYIRNVTSIAGIKRVARNFMNDDRILLSAHYNMGDGEYNFEVRELENKDHILATGHRYVDWVDAMGDFCRR